MDFHGGTRCEQQGYNLLVTSMQIVESRSFNSVLESEAAISFYPNGINLENLSNSLFIQVDLASITVLDKEVYLNLFTPGTGQHH